MNLSSSICWLLVVLIVFGAGCTPAGTPIASGGIGTGAGQSEVETPAPRSTTEGDNMSMDLSFVAHEPFDLPFGRAAQLGEGDLVVSFVEVVRDERCAINALCIQSASVEIGIEVSRPGTDPTTFTLNPNPLWRSSGEWAPTMVMYEGYGIVLLAVTPYPQDPSDLEKTEQYSANLIVFPLDDREPVAVALDTPFALAVGQRAELAEQGIGVSFESIVFDDRCDLDALCETDGPIDIEVLIEEPGREPILREMSHAPWINNIPHAVHDLSEFRLELLHVTPYPVGDLPDDIDHAIFVIHSSDEKQGGAELGEPFELKYWHQAVVGDGEMVVTFQRIVEDLRCPSNYDCEEDGPVTIELLVEIPGREPTTIQIVEFPYYNGDPKALVTVHDYTFDLISVQPRPEESFYPVFTQVATLVISR